MKAAFHSLLIVIVDRENPNVQHLYFQSYKVKGPITKRLIDFYNGSCTYSKFWDLSTYCDTDWYYFFHRSSDGIHDKQTKCDLTESETTYCHHAIWPFLRTVLKFLDVPENMAYNFKIGETPYQQNLVQMTPRTKLTARYYWKKKTWKSSCWRPRGHTANAICPSMHVTTWKAVSDVRQCWRRSLGNTSVRTRSY